MLKSDKLSRYSQNRGMIKLDAMKHLHKKSIHRYEQSMVHQKLAIAQLECIKVFHQNMEN